MEREFLKLAATWLGYRLNVMGGDVRGGGHRPVRNMPDLGWALLGMVDHAAEMRALCAEVTG
jgi:hypothetical protein